MGISSLFRSYFVHSNLYISLGAAASTAQSIWIWHSGVHWHVLIPIVFLGTLSMYILHRSMGLYQIMQQVRNIPERFKPILTQRVLFIVLGICSALACMYLLVFQCTSRTIWLFLPPTFISLAYALPVLGGRRIRDFGMLKVPILALTWTWITALLPLQIEQWPLNSASWVFLAERFFFLMAITLPFEVRDITMDWEEGVRTLVHSLGVPALRGLALGCALLGMGSSMMLYVLHFYNSALLIALLISWIVVLIFIYFLNTKRKSAYYEIGLDGMLIVQSALVYLARWSV